MKNLRSKLRSEDEHKMNSPWNIASYPYLVSKLCKLMDEDVFQKEKIRANNEVWTNKDAQIKTMM